MSSLKKFNWSRTTLSAILLSAIFFGASILGIPGISAAQAINPVLQQIPMPGHPFAAITTPNGRYVFVSTTVPTSGVTVLRQKKTFAAVVQTVSTCGPAFGMAMSKGGRYLLVAVQMGASCPDGGVQFIDVRKAIAGDSTAAMGTVPTYPSAIEVAISPDNKLVFVANEFSGGNTCDKPGDQPDTVSVIDFKKALSSGQDITSVIGEIPVDCGTVGLAVSRDSRYLYITNEAALTTRSFYDPSACDIPNGSGECPITTHKGSMGTVDVADLRIARTDPANSVISFVPAGCSPTRVILTNHDKVAWVSARDDNNLLAFKARDLRTNSLPAPLSTTPVGVAPDGAQPFSHRRYIAVANTNRFDGCPGAGGTVSILNFNTTLKSGGSAATVGTFDAGVFPRQWGISPNGKFLYLTEFSSNILAIFPAKSIVHQVH
jgi:DNA-binding beta-propeller fold protein YncE